MKHILQASTHTQVTAPLTLGCDANRLAASLLHNAVPTRLVQMTCTNQRAHGSQTTSDASVRANQHNPASNNKYMQRSGGTAFSKTKGVMAENPSSPCSYCSVLLLEPVNWSPPALRKWPRPHCTSHMHNTQYTSILGWPQTQQICTHLLNLLACCGGEGLK